VYTVRCSAGRREVRALARRAGAVGQLNTVRIGNEALNEKRQI
jgi:hypothetical protein